MDSLNVLTAVRIEQCVACPTLRHVGNLPGQVVCVIETRVKAHAEDRHGVSSVAGKLHAPVFIMGGYFCPASAGMSNTSTSRSP